MGNNLIEKQPLLTQVESQLSRQRQTADNSIGGKFGRGLRGAALTAANIAAPFSPTTASVLTAAVNGTGTLNTVAAGTSVAPNASMLGSTTAAVNGTGIGGGFNAGGGFMDAIAQRAQGGDASAQMMMATRQMQELNQQFNLQYLTLQQKIQGENRQYTALSNVMKSKHDTAKNALNNLK